MVVRVPTNSRATDRVKNVMPLLVYVAGLSLEHLIHHLFVRDVIGLLSVEIGVEHVPVIQVVCLALSVHEHLLDHELSAHWLLFGEIDFFRLHGQRLLERGATPLRLGNLLRNELFFFLWRACVKIVGHFVLIAMFFNHLIMPEGIQRSIFVLLGLILAGSLQVIQMLNWVVFRVDGGQKRSLGVNIFLALRHVSPTFLLKI